ncbi:NAD(P)-binding protein [Acephala macrosclerotiorum]|nr:NAD(P)-binding protein [Acephala macrosclerotiorum]
MTSFAEIQQYLRGQIFGKPFVPNVNVSNKAFVVTGGNTGLGLECAKHLAGLNAGKIILGCRNVEKGEAAKKFILKHFSRSSIKVWQVDLRDFKSVLAFGNRLKTLPRLDGFVANAGLETVTFELTEGYENMLTVNVISTTLLAVLALPKLKETAKSNGSHTNLVIVGSMQHVFAPSDQLKVPEGRNILEKRYELTKLMVQRVGKELAERLAAGAKGGRSQVVVNCVNLIVGFIFSLIWRTAESGSRTLVHGVTAGEETHGQYLSECLIKTESTFVRSKESSAAQKRLWKDVSEKIESLSPGALSVVN